MNHFFKFIQKRSVLVGAIASFLILSSNAHAEYFPSGSQFDVTLNEVTRILNTPSSIVIYAKANLVSRLGPVVTGFYGRTFDVEVSLPPDFQADSIDIRYNSGSMNLEKKRALRLCYDHIKSSFENANANYSFSVRLLGNGPINYWDSTSKISIPLWALDSLTWCTLQKVKLQES